MHFRHLFHHYNCLIIIPVEPEWNQRPQIGYLQLPEKIS